MRKFSSQRLQAQLYGDHLFLCFADKGTLVDTKKKTDKVKNRI